MLILYEEEWNQANKDTRSAIQRWVRTGGHLVIIGDKETNRHIINGLNRDLLLDSAWLIIPIESNESRIPS